MSEVSVKCSPSKMKRKNALLFCLQNETFAIKIVAQNALAQLSTKLQFYPFHFTQFTVFSFG